MARPKGTRNPGYEEKRAQLATAVMQLLMAEAEKPSMRGMADAAGVSVPTMKHYFGSVEGAVAAAIDLMGTFGEPHLEQTRSHNLGPLDLSMGWFLDTFLEGWTLGVGRMVSIGFELGMFEDELGPAFINRILEPTLQALEVRLAWHAEQGHLHEDVSLRLAALALVSPVMMALLHQGPLGGNRCRPLDVEQFAGEHLDAWLRGYGS